MRERLLSILEPYRGRRETLIPVLQKVQEELGYLPENTLSEVAYFLGLSRSEVYGVASFYAQFRFEQPGEHNIKICQGTACYVQGGRRILKAIEDALGILPEKTTTEDHKFDLERVACVGCCALAPVMIIDEVVHAKMTIAKGKEILNQY